MAITDENTALHERARAEQFRDVYTIEKISTKEGWAPAAPDENLTMGYQAELEDFVSSIAAGRPRS